MMECGIIRDLFPSYIDGLTSEESNHAIREHLEECPECRGYLETMKAELVSGEYRELNKSQAKKEIKVFEKLRRRIFYAVIITAIVVGLLCTAYEDYFVGGYSTLPGDVEITYENVDGVAVIGLIPKENDVYIQGLHDHPEGEVGETIVLINYHIRPLTIPEWERGLYLRYIFRNDGTVIHETSNGRMVELQGDETLTIEFGIFEFKIAVNDLRTEAGAEKLRQWLKTEAERLEKLED